MSPQSGSGTEGSRGAVLDPTMSLVGRLEDLSLGEILQIVSLSKRSGLLRLEGPGEKANIYIRAGKVMYASTSDEKEGVFHLLYEGELLAENEVEPLRQILEGGVSRAEFRSLLSQKTGLTDEGFQDFLRKRVEELVYSLFRWEEGTFSFQLIEDETTHPLLSKVGPFFLDDGIGAQFLVMEGARLKDEQDRDQQSLASVKPAFPVEGDWEQEFEEQLTGERAEGHPRQEVATDGESTAPEPAHVDQFEVPENLPTLPGETADAIVMIGLPGPLAAEITSDLNSRGVTFQIHKDGADGISRIQELRQQKIEPLVLIDVDAPGITDELNMGGLETITTMWDLGFHLPAVLVSRRELDPGIVDRLSTVPGMTLLNVDDPPSPGDVLNVIGTVTGALQVEPKAPGAAAPLSRPAPEIEGEGEEYYDIQQEFSEDLEEIDLPLDSWADPDSIPQPEYQDPHMARLGSYVSELNRQDISGEITLLALRFASAFVSRAVLFLLRKDDLKGLGQFGVELPEGRNADSAVRSLTLPVEKQSIFDRVSRNKQSYVGQPTGSATENALFNSLGGGVPNQIYIGPVVSMGKVAVLLYGDDFPEGQGLEPTQTLDIFLSHVGLALDRAFLEMKLKQR